MVWRSTCPHPQRVNVGSRAWLSSETAPLQLAPRASQRGTGALAFLRPLYSLYLFLGWAHLSSGFCSSGTQPTPLTRAHTSAITAPQPCGY